MKNLINGDSATLKIFNSEGYFMDGDFYYYRKDHLGNNCEVWNATQNITVQRTDYYPSGMPMYSPNTLEAEHNPQKLNRHKYNGKEFIEDLGYDSYDYGARIMYPAIMRFSTLDPLAEKYYSI
ncbi:MAG: RHS repeat-associated core domain-containing protein, partial [Prevotellaceae bacterium]|nr:RHS repeat-associated core domain-containing protein [Prevotellaceae bacterium]